MQYTISQLHQHLFHTVFEVYEVFKSFFGEEVTDLQFPINSSETQLKSTLLSYSIKEHDGIYYIPDTILQTLTKRYQNHRAFIYIWFPEVTVTNENNRSINIQDLYARVEITTQGQIPVENRGFLLNRATYTALQFHFDYMHSHIHNIPKDDFTEFQSPCLGSGPISNTIHTLRFNYDETLWMLFCQELSLYVTVESLKGGPWRRMESIGAKKKQRHFNYELTHHYSRSTFISYFNNNDKVLIDFLQYYLTHGHLSFNYTNNQFTPALSYFEYTIDVSNAFIDFYNKQLIPNAPSPSSLFANNFLEKVFVYDNKFYYSFDNTIQDNSSYIGKHVLYFKGQDIKLNILSSGTAGTQEPTIILNHDSAMCVLTTILRIINFRYNNEQQSLSEDAAHPCTPENTPAAKTHQRAIYL